jgi:3-isopropylmalate/(R)-2-methylmalate dehydratase large subunit
MTARTLYEKLWDSHLVHEAPDGTALVYIDRHLVHEVTSPQAYEGLKLAGRKPWRVDSIVATADHNTPTRRWDKGMAGIEDAVSRLQVETLDANIKEYGAKVYFPYLTGSRASFTSSAPSRARRCPARRSSAAIPIRAPTARWDASRSASARAKSSTCWRPSAW